MENAELLAGLRLLGSWAPVDAASGRPAYRVTALHGEGARPRGTAVATAPLS